MELNTKKANSNLIKIDCGCISNDFYGVSNVEETGLLDICWNCLAKAKTKESNNTLSDLIFLNKNEELKICKTLK